uniref:Uncharacterized protein n=1 Tax=Lygus hesperus TaxID=30085 RepID=A0A0A9YQS6_LYGHE
MTLSDVILSPLYRNAKVLDGSILSASFINRNVDVVSSDFTDIMMLSPAPESSSFCPDNTQCLTSLGNNSDQGIEMISRAEVATPRDPSLCPANDSFREVDG